MPKIGRRVPQLWDDVTCTLVLPPETEEWVDEILENLADAKVTRDENEVRVENTTHGNCDGVTSLRMWLDDVEDALTEAEVDIMEFTVQVTAKEPTSGSI